MPLPIFDGDGQRGGEVLVLREGRVVLESKKRRAHEVARRLVGEGEQRGETDERLLVGEAPSQAAFLATADAILAGAVGQGGNDFKIPLARRAIVRALKQAAAGTPQSQTDHRVA